MRTNRIIAALLALALAPLAGCVTISVDKPNWTMPWSPAAEPCDISQVAAVWADGLVMQADPAQSGKVMPGFAGRVYLFNPGMTATRQAHGSLVVCLFDNTQAPAGAEVPPKEVWNIDEATLASVMKKDVLGYGYNLWIPWSTISPETTTVRLTVMYKDSSGGPPIYGAPTDFPVRIGAGWHQPSALQVAPPVQAKPNLPR